MDDVEYVRVRRRRVECPPRGSSRVETKSSERERELLAVPTRTVSAAFLPGRRSIELTSGKRLGKPQKLGKTSWGIMTSRAAVQFNSLILDLGIVFQSSFKMLLSPSEPFLMENKIYLGVGK